MVKIDMPAGVGAPPLDTTPEIMLAYNIPTPNDRFIVDSDSGFNIYTFPLDTSYWELVSGPDPVQRNAWCQQGIWPQLWKFQRNLSTVYL